MIYFDIAFSIIVIKVKYNKVNGKHSREEILLWIKRFLVEKKSQSLKK